MTTKEFREYGFRRIVCAVPEIKIADVDHNVERMIEIIRSNSDADLILFPELCVTGYSCGDLFNQQLILDKAQLAISKVADATKNNRGIVVFGSPYRHRGRLYNCAVVCHEGIVSGIVPKIHIPNYSEFYEARWFASGEELKNDEECYIDLPGNFYRVNISPYQIFSFSGIRLAVEICEDLWVPNPPSGFAALAGANVIANLSASNETIGKHRYRRELIAQQSARCRAVYAYASAGPGESSTDIAFPGYAAIAEDGSILAESFPFHEGEILVRTDVDVDRLEHDRLRTSTFVGRGATLQEVGKFEVHDCVPRETENPIFSNGPSPQEGEQMLQMQTELLRYIDPHPFVPSDPTHRNENCTEIVNIQCHGLRQRLSAIHCDKLVIGVSGGLDSTLALLVACRTFDRMGLSREGIIGITMPGLATTSKTRGNAWELMERLGVTALEIPINPAVAQHFRDIDQNPEKHDAAFENSQARERTQILMDYANKCGGIVLGTGDLSELALGWCTYNGDHMSMYGINASVPKTLVRHLVEWFADREKDKEISRILIDIVNTPISPELIPSSDDADTIAQKTEDLVGPYELHDFFLFHTLRNGFSPKKILTMALKAFEDSYDRETILKWERNFYRRFFNQQFKRSCMPDGPKVGSVCLSPRGDWRMPSDASSAMWLKELKDL